MNKVKVGNRPTEKILVTIETKRELIQMKQPGERYGDVVARLLQEQKKNDYLSYLKSLAKDGDFVNLDTDEEYNQIRKKVAVTADRDWKKGSELYINSLPEKDRTIIKKHLAQLEDPTEARDVELLRDGICRMHIAHSYTAFFTIFPNCVRILDVMTIEQAHKKYKRV